MVNTSGAITTTGAFTSVGITDGAVGATAITIDSSENVTFGGSGSPTRVVTINGGTHVNPSIQLNGGSSSTDNSSIQAKYTLAINADSGSAITGRSVDIQVSGTTKLQIATADVTVSTGNLVIGTAGKGIDFSADANASGMTGELLDDYETGTGTPVVKIGATTCSLTSSNGYHYTKIGNRVFFSVEFRIGNLNGGSGEVTVDLPFTAETGSYTAGAVRIYSGTVDGNEFSAVYSGGTTIAFIRNVNGSGTASMTVPVGAFVFTSIHYETAA